MAAMPAAALPRLVANRCCGPQVLTFTAPQRLEDRLVSKSVLATLHYQGEPVVDALLGLLLQKPK